MTLDILKDKNLCIIEGFDMVGKTTFIKNFMSDFKYYHPNHDITDCTVGRDHSWTIGYGIIDFFSQVGTDNIKAVIDRGIASGYVYRRLYHGIDVLDPIMDVVEWYSYSDFFKSLCHIHICHYNKDTAREIYEKSQSREANPNAVSAALDKFYNFEAYWDYYCKAEKFYDIVYEMLKIKPIRVASLPSNDDEGVRVVLFSEDGIVGNTLKAGAD